ncbi:chemotaxis protein CheX [Oerskovia turbata]|uniref:Chemotaxis protein CheX n=1 Tax=Oerskovia turbata TaxID=1713 RepID=A0A4Q1KS19_9CELL|nr:chemotaxis protein CheX [Oerskovia turbata]RXR23663.1 chemotaxis protein CheX [Oerskovia turbata]RXR32933.1 chemotaxis protein CheX [Oerskovia turbata]TGJ95228.1 chemotaxis protein CheX [Actinotalea fermentans ATCC 43279 = JCM 9966 = DSM 3133]
MTDTTSTLAQSVVPMAQDLFTAMVDGEPGLLLPVEALEEPIADPLYAWVDIVGPAVSRTLVITARETADRLARSLLLKEEDEPVTLEDVQDALGEVANVVGGNLKAMMPEGSSLTLPVVEHVEPSASRPADHEQALLWWGGPILIQLWTSTNGEDL